MAAKKLLNARVGLIEKVNEALLKDLIDHLRVPSDVPPVLTGREANQILQANQVTEDKTGQLVDMVYKKGDKASNRLFDILKVKAGQFFEDLKLDLDVVDGQKRIELDQHTNFC